ncbi:VanZ family protein [Ideonella livida]|uniref:Teicoplanin resistance protein VanZ n=1 Tax=Ideonella livida TaxID=2707176 RepID=A0A7C9PJB6_9BURK|nr:teicoplanin resistance protein VanZ [Ideonella livida]NDY92651.1 teicoplanin resistance protein VanZ [Ideonella livida]
MSRTRRSSAKAPPDAAPGSVTGAEGQPPRGHRSSALPLAWALAALVAYASLYPFVGWRWPAGLSPEALLVLPLPPWRVPFDMVANGLGYVPLGLLVCLAGLRQGLSWPLAWGLAILAPGAWSYLMECLQHLLPGRFPSRLDWLLNLGGAAVGGMLGCLLRGSRWLARWQRWRQAWLVERSAGALVLLALWPLALLFPTALPFGLGVEGVRLQDALVDLLLDVPWAQSGLEWVLAWSLGEAPLGAGSELSAAVLGLLAPCCIAHAVLRGPGHRAVAVPVVMGVGGLAATASAGLNFGAVHALAWVTPLLLAAGGLAALAGLACALAPQRLNAALGMVGVALLLQLVLQAPADPYLAASLQGWEMSRWARFHGLAQWLGWGWPLAALCWLGWRVALPQQAVDGASAGTVPAGRRARG